MTFRLSLLRLLVRYGALCSDFHDLQAEHHYMRKYTPTSNFIPDRSSSYIEPTKLGGKLALLDGSRY